MSRKTYKHYVYSTKPESLAAAYQQAGFIAEAEERGEGLVMVYTSYDDAVRDRVISIAEELGATYDGGGMYFGSLEALS